MENILEVFLTNISDGGGDERFENMIKSRQFSHLKVPQIKTLLTYYHTNGYPLPRAISTLKKGDLIKLLNDIVDDEIKKESRRLDREIKPNYQTSSSLSTRPPSLPSNNPPMPHPGSSMTSLQDPLQHDFEESDESDDVISTLSAGSQPPSDLPVHEQIIRNPLNRTVLADLKMSFFTLDQIVDAIKESYDTSDAIIDFDVVMFAILNKVEVSIHDMTIHELNLF